MPAISTKGVNVFMQLGAATADALTVTAISKANPAVVTADNTVAQLAKGDIVTFGNQTGFTELNGKSFIVTTASPTQVTIAVDLTAATGTLDTTNVTADGYKLASDFVKLCLNQLDIGAASVNDINVGTFCGPATISGQPTLGSLTVGGYVDPADAGYLEVMKAELDGKPRAVVVELPANYGYLMGVVTIGSVSWAVPLEGGIAWTATASQNTQIRYFHA